MVDHTHEWKPTTTGYECAWCPATTPACATCNRPTTEPTNCHTCRSRMVGHLTRIPHLWDELNRTPPTLKSPTLDPPITGTHETTIPGGLATILKAGGTTGTVTADRHGNRHPEDQQPTDPPSIPATLSDIEDAWRRHFHHSAAPGPQDVHRAARYLQRHTQKAADSMDWFGDCLTAVRDAERHLERALHAGEARADTPAPCPACGGGLERTWGEKPAWACTACHHPWTTSDLLRSVPDDTLAPADAVAAIVGVSPWTVRSWHRRGRLRAHATPQDGRTTYLFRVGDARAAAGGTP